MEDFGLPRKTIDAIEAPMSGFTFETIVERMDQVFNKNWSYRFEGPDLIQVPTEVPKVKGAKNPKVFKTVDVPHWHCICSISISTSEMFDIVREYSVLVPATEPGAFCVARDLSLIYAGYYGLRVGKRSDVVFNDANQVEVEVQLGGSDDEVSNTLRELADIKSRMGIVSNKDLDKYVQEFSNGELTSHMKITKTNLRDFTDYLKTRVG